MAEQPLEGGIANGGQVFRDGAHVLRPGGPHSASIHAFLRAVHRAGFDGAPIPVGIDEDGRERLVFIDGDVPLTPYPDWCQSDTALASIAALLRGLHDAASGFDPTDHTWDHSLADPAGGTVVCHNDLELSNIVFRDGVAVAHHLTGVRDPALELLLSQPQLPPARCAARSARTSAAKPPTSFTS
jgi:hypothetical protein